MNYRRAGCCPGSISGFKSADLEVEARSNSNSNRPGGRTGHGSLTDNRGDDIQQLHVPTSCPKNGKCKECVVEVAEGMVAPQGCKKGYNSALGSSSTLFRLARAPKWRRTMNYRGGEVVVVLPAPTVS